MIVLWIYLWPCVKARGAYIGIHETQKKLAGDGERSPEIAAELLGVGLRGTRWGSTRQGQGLNEAVCVGLNALPGQTRTCPICLSVSCLARATHCLPG